MVRKLNPPGVFVVLHPQAALAIAPVILVSMTWCKVVPGLAQCVNLVSSRTVEGWGYKLRSAHMCFVYTNTNLYYQHIFCNFSFLFKN